MIVSARHTFVMWLRKMGHWGRGNVGTKAKRTDISTNEPHFEAIFVKHVVTRKVSHNITVFNRTKTNGAGCRMLKIVIGVFVFFLG